MAVQANADLLQDYMQSDTTGNRTQTSYGFGVNIPATNTAGNVVNFSAGLQKKGCGNFNLASEISNIFSAEAADKYVQGLEGAIVNGAPLMLMCYMSQTMCDLYKHFRNMANAALSMRQMQCQQIENLAADAGTSLRASSVMNCIAQQSQNSDLPYESIVASCSSASNNMIEIPGSGALAANFDLTKVIGNAVGSGNTPPAVTDFIKGVMGNVQFSASAGITSDGKQQYPMETKLSTLTSAYYGAVKDVGEQAAKSRTMPSPDTVQTISTPGFPITPVVLTRLSAMDVGTRDNFYRQYSTVAAMTALLYQIEEAINALESAKASAKDKDTIAKLQDGLTSLQRGYDMMEKRLVLQERYLNPMFNTIMNYVPPAKRADPTPEERRFVLPQSILPTN
jgi:hypothetical protein